MKIGITADIHLKKSKKESPKRYKALEIILDELKESGAFGFNFIPHNGMSSLFHCCYKFFKNPSKILKGWRKDNLSARMGTER